MRKPLLLLILSVVIILSVWFAIAGEARADEAKDLWQQGEKFCSKGAFIECFAMLKVSLSLAPDTQREAGLKAWEDKTRPKRDKALKLRERAMSIQEKDPYGARKLYMESQKLWPDPLLAFHIEELKSWQAKKLNNVYIADASPCELLDIWDVAIPADFSFSYQSGSRGSEQRSWTITTLLPNRRIQDETHTRARPRWVASKTTTTSDRQVDLDKLVIFWNALSSCGFAAMQSSYQQPGFKQDYATPSNLGSTFNGKKVSVNVSPRTFMGRVTYLIKLFRELRAK